MTMGGSKWRILVRCVLASVLLWAAFAKLLNGHNQMRPVTVFDEWTSHSSVRIALIAGEIALAVWLISGLWNRMAAVTLLVLLSAFSAVLTLELKREHPKPCGCMGPAAAIYDPAVIRKSLDWSLARNGALMFCAASLFVRAERRGSKEAD